MNVRAALLALAIAASCIAQPATVPAPPEAVAARAAWHNAVFRATHPNGGALRAIQGRLVGASDAEYEAALQSLARLQNDDGGFSGEKAGSSLDDFTTQAPTEAAVERIAELMALGRPVPPWLSSMATRGVACLLSAQHPSGLFVQAVYDVPAREAYRLEPTLNDAATSATVRVLARALAVLGPSQGLGWRRSVEGALRRCGNTLVRLHQGGGTFYDQYRGASWRPVNPPALLPTSARPHEQPLPSNKAAMYAAEALMDIHAALADERYLGVARDIADGLERRAYIIGDGAQTATDGGWWPAYYESNRNPVPVFVTPNGDHTRTQLEAHSPSGQWWFRFARSTLVRARG